MSAPTVAGREVFSRDGRAVESYNVIAADRIITYTAECDGTGWTVTDNATGVKLGRHSAERRDVVEACLAWARDYTSGGVWA